MDAENRLSLASCISKRTPDYHLSRIGDLLPGVLEAGRRMSKNNVGGSKSRVGGLDGGRKRLYPTNSERMNRALRELGPSAFKIHTLLWQWRGAPARGCLPYFTIHGLSKFCGLSRPTVRSGLLELVRLGWIQKLGYDKHHKNELYRLVPIREVGLPMDARPRRGGAMTQPRGSSASL